MKSIFLSVFTFVALCIWGAGAGWAEIIELNGTNAEVTASTSDGYNNSNAETTSTLTMTGTNGVNLSVGAVTGNINVVGTFPSFTNNNANRLILGAGSNFTGTISIANGILHMTSSTHLGSGLILDKGSLMSATNQNDFSTDMTIVDGSWGGLRPSAGMKFRGNIAGGGDLVVLTENGTGLSLYGTASTYTGVTSVGTIQGGTNAYATLSLGADNVLPDTTVLEIGKSQNSAYGYSNASSVVNWNGTTQTIAGLYGIGGIKTTLGGTLKINLADNKSYEYSGAITASGTTKLNISIDGTGSQTLGNATGIGSLTVGSGVTFDISEGKKIEAGTITLPNEVTYRKVKDQVFTSSMLTVNGLTVFDLNGEDLRLTSLVNFGVTNSNTTDLSTLTWQGVKSAIAQMTYGKKISGNVRLVVDLPRNDNNGCRFTLTNSGNDIQGGVEVRQGTFQMDAAITLPNNTIDLNGGSLKTNATAADYTLNLMENGGALRMSGATTFTGKITGVGSLEIVNDNEVILTNTENDYQGDTIVNKTAWRSGSGNDADNNAVLKLGAAGVLPDTTVVQLGGGVGRGTSTLNLQGFTETVAGLRGSNKGIVTGTVGSRLILDMTTEQLYEGKIAGDATVVKQGEGTLFLTGDSSASSTATLEMKAGVVRVITKNALPGIVKVTGNSTLLVDTTSVYERVLQQTTYHSNPVDYSNAEFVRNMDKIANTAYAAGAFDSSDWGDFTVDQANMNALRTMVVNTTDAPITLDFGYLFRNKVYLSVTEDGGSTEVVLDWNATETSNGSTGTGSYTFDPGVKYTIETRLYRFNKTIGAQGGGINGASGTLVGLGAKVQGSTEEYLPLNYLEEGNWTFDDGSFQYADCHALTRDMDVAADATLTLKNIPKSCLIEYNHDFTGTGTVRFDSEAGEGIAIFNGNAAGNVIVADGMTFTTTEGAKVDGSFQMEAGAVYIIDDTTGVLEVGSLGGAGTYRVDVDSFNKTSGSVGAFIKFTDDIDVKNIVLELVTDNPVALVNGPEVRIFEGISAEQMASMLPEGSIWYVVQGESGLAYQVNASAIPEPATWLLFVLGAGLGLVVRNRRNAKKS